MRRAWWLAGPGGADAFELVERPFEPLAEGWLRIRVEAFGLNRSELFSRRGMSSPDFSFPRVLGLECAGRVDDAGATDLREDDRVVALMGGMGRAFDGSYATHVDVPRTQVFRAPEALSAEVLGAVPETYNTAYGVCVESLKLTSEDRVLVRGGTSALGRAACEIAKDLGCVVVGTSRSPDKAAQLANASRFDHVLVDGSDLGDRVRERVGELSAVVDCVGSKESVESACGMLASGGRLGLVGQLSETWDGARPTIPDHVSQSFTRSDLIAAPKDDERMRVLLDRVAAGRWAPNVDRVFSFEELPAAHEAMGANRAIGKIVVVVK
ncbi:MAG: zinc-binding dehydrogenase [Myxococcota bacterium]